MDQTEQSKSPQSESFSFEKIDPHFEESFRIRLSFINYTGKSIFVRFVLCLFYFMFVYSWEDFEIFLSTVNNHKERKNEQNIDYYEIVK